MTSMDLCGSGGRTWFRASSNSSVDWWSMDFLNELQKFSKWYQPVHGYICLFLCSFGLLANVLNFLVLTRPNMRTSMNIILAAIALCDAGTMCTYLIYVIRFYIVDRNACLGEIYTYNWMVFILFHSLWSILLHSSSIWLAVLLAFMRLTVMRRANLSHSFLKAANVWKPMFYIYSSLVCLCVPVIFTHSVVQIPLDPCKNSNFGYTVMPSRMALEKDCLLLRSVLIINGVCFKLLPCLLLVISIWRLLSTLAAAKRRNTRILRRKSESGEPGGHGKYFSNRTTKMLLTILSIFLATELPQAFVATLSGLNPGDIYFKVYPFLGDLLDLLSLLNSGVNFILYCCMSSRFRSTFIDLFAPRTLRRHLNSPISERDNVQNCDHSRLGSSTMTLNRRQSYYTNQTNSVLSICNGNGQYRRRNRLLSVGSGGDAIEKSPLNAMNSLSRSYMALGEASLIMVHFPSDRASSSFTVGGK